MGEPTDNQAGSSLDELLKQSRIVSVLNGYVDPRVNSLKAILEAVDTSENSKFQKEFPVAILAVTGPPSSGKSFLTNFLIQYFQCGGEGGWMSKIIKRSERGEPMMERGFAWDSVSSQNFYRPDHPFSGIYLWPEPFLIEKDGGKKKVIVWIMHLNSGADEKEGDMKQLERFLMAACSRIMEIKWNDDDFQHSILEHRRFILPKRECLPSDLVSLEDLCKSVVFMILSDTAKTKVESDDDAKESLLELLNDSSEKKQTYKKFLDDFQHVSLAWIKNSKDTLQNSEGVLNVTAMKKKKMFPVIKKAVEAMTDENEIEGKLNFGEQEQVTLGNMYDFIVKTARAISRKTIRHGREQTKEEEKSAVNDWKPNAQNANLYANSGRQTTVHSSFVTIEINETEHLEQKGSVETLESGRKINEAYSRFENFERKSQSVSQQFDDLKWPENSQFRHYQTAKSSELSTKTVVTTQIGHRNAELNSKTGPAPPDRDQILANSAYSLHNKSFATGHTDSALISSVPPTAPQCSTEDCSISSMDIDENPNMVSQTKSGDKIFVVQALVKSTIPEEEDKMETDSESEDSLIEAVAGLSLDNKQVLRAEEAVKDVRIACSEEKAAGTAAEEVEKVTKEAEATARQEDKEKAIKKTEDIRKTRVAAEAEKESAAKEAEARRKQKADEDKKRKIEHEEKLRREEEDARKVMEECLHVAIVQMQQAFPLAVEHWMKNNFSYSRMNEIGTIYAHVLTGTSDEYQQMQVTHPKIWKEFVDRLDKHCKGECMAALKSISELLLSFNRALKKQFDIHGYFMPAKLKQMVEDEYSKILDKTDNDFIRRMIKLAVENLFEFYKGHNRIIADEEKTLRSIAVSQLTNVYHDQMKRYLKDAPYNPERLQRIHWKLVEKLVDAFKKAFRLSINVDENIMADSEDFKNALSSAYATHKEKNESRLTKLQLEINKILQKFKGEYNQKAEEILKNNSDGLDSKTLKKLHAGIENEVIKLLELEIKLKIRPDEPLDNHKLVLQNHINSYWTTVEDANNKNLQKKREWEEQEKRERKKKEAQMKLQEHEKGISKNNLSSSEVDSASGHVTGKSEDKRHVLPPLIFHLQSSRVVMAMGIDGHAEILKNEFGELQTPGFIVLTPENQFIYGSEALSIVESPALSSCTGGFFWSVADFFMTSDLTWSRQVVIDGNDHLITTEFLIGFLLGKLKHHAEMQMKGQYSTTVLAIPFWLSSAQRVKVKDGAKIAGFTEVYLVNEASAAAYNFVVSEKRAMRSNEMIVVSENLDRVDAFVYSYCALDKKLKMLGHSSNYGIDENESKKKSLGITKTIRKGVSAVFNKVYNYITTQEPVKIEVDQTTRDIRSACKVAMDRASQESSGRKLELNESLYICEKEEKWSAVLDKVSRDFGRRACDIREDMAVITGAVILGQAPNEIGNSIRDKLAYDVFRISGYGAPARVICKEETLPIKPKKQNTSLSNGHDKAHIFQHVFGSRHSIGDLYVPGSIRYSQQLEPNLEITNEGIVSLKSLGIKSNFGEYSSYLVDEQFQWKTPNLAQEDVGSFIDVMNEVLGPPLPPEDPVLTQAKADLLQKCQEMTEKINTNQFRIKSQMVKDKVLEQVSVAAQFGKLENCTLDNIQKQMQFIEKLCTKYEN